MKTYRQKLQDPRWQQRRLEILELANYECEDCGESAASLHVHHKIYRRGREPWEYSDDDLQCLCENCHKEQHYLTDKLREIISRNPQIMVRLLGYAEAIEAVETGVEEITLVSYEHAEGISGVTHETVKEIFARAEAGKVKVRS